MPATDETPIAGGSPTQANPPIEPQPMAQPKATDTARPSADDPPDDNLPQPAHDDPPVADDPQLDPAPPSSTDPCDGSDDIWFGYTNGGGFVMQSYAFTDRYGGMFLFLDGHCDFYARWGHRLVSGHLETGSQVALAKRLNVAAIRETPRWSDGTCPDAGEARLWVQPQHHVACSCGCDPGAPEDAAMAFQTAIEVLEELLEAGEPVTGPLRAIAERVEPGTPWQADNLPAWPLATPIEDVPDLLQPDLFTVDLSAADAGAALEGQDAARLRGMWSEDPPAQLQVRQGDDLYDVWLRDDPPASVVDAIEMLTGGQSL